MIFWNERPIECFSRSSWDTRLVAIQQDTYGVWDPQARRHHIRRVPVTDCFNEGGLELTTEGIFFVTVELK
jgi:hypothetical protein